MINVINVHQLFICYGLILTPLSEWLDAEERRIDEEESTYSAMKVGDPDQGKYLPAFLDLKGSVTGNKGRRESTWALKNKEEIANFLTSLYSREESPWFQGFHSQHSQALHSFIAIKKFEKNTKLAFEVWDTTKGQFPNLDSAQGASSDLGLDFRLAGYKCQDLVNLRSTPPNTSKVRQSLPYLVQIKIWVIRYNFDKHRCCSHRPFRSPCTVGVFAIEGSVSKNFTIVDEMIVPVSQNVGSFATTFGMLTK